MPVVSKTASASQCKRLACVLAVASFCALIGACSNDDKPADTPTADSSSSDSPTGNSNAQTSTQDNPLAVSPAPAAVTIQTPALPASGSDADLSAAASTPLATPVIHTVD